MWVNRADVGRKGWPDSPKTCVLLRNLAGIDLSCPATCRLMGRMPNEDKNDANAHANAGAKRTPSSGALLAAAEALLDAKDNQMVTPAEWRALRRAVRHARRRERQPTAPRPRP